MVAFAEEASRGGDVGEVVVVYRCGGEEVFGFGEGVGEGEGEGVELGWGTGAAGCAREGFFPEGGVPVGGTGGGVVVQVLECWGVLVWG